MEHHNGFNHSVKVPMQYRRAAVVFRKALNEGKSIKSLIFEERHAKIPNLFALLNKYSNNKAIIESAIENTGILADNSRLDPILCRVLITELLFGTKNLKGQSKPVLCVASYEEKLKEFVTSEEYQLHDNQEFKPRYVRINTNLLSPEQVFDLLHQEEWRRVDKSFTSYDEYLKSIQEIEEDQYLVDMHVSNLLVFAPSSRNYWAFHESVSEGKLMLQDKATSIVSEFLNPKPDSIVLDMCAAPGMKTIHLSNIMNNTGTIYAIEQDARRYNTLCDMIKMSNATCVKTIKGDALAIGRDQLPGVEYILVDPSCSGSGMQSRITLKGDDEKDTERLSKLAGLQIKLLRYAMEEFPNVKRIVYSTCSLHEEENEQVVSKCLQTCSGFKLLNGKKLLQRKWNNVGNKNYEKVGKNCIYSRPNMDFTDGIFIAVLERIKDK